ncbi:hypothetical protein PsorP6_015121 [Peronosclerospora sorghi]|uniref:Uncharacterized protein n=1 Tax=Peronosclerospora sorghi TaxID=230839 RepID=A0ACC0VTN9_9STRA|nr:hypothetical protein PsorP6_015121 [Peronosclerospora sorghi]
MFELSTTKDEFVSTYKLALDAADVDRNGLKVGRWAVGLLRCYVDCIPNGCMAFTCPGVAVAQTVARLGLMRYGLALQLYVVLCGLALETILLDSALLTLLCMLGAMAAAMTIARLRTKMRALFEIPGNQLQDMATVFLCGPCAIAQMASHAEAYEAGTCSFRARSTLDGYVRL